MSNVEPNSALQTTCFARFRLCCGNWGNTSRASTVSGDYFTARTISGQAGHQIHRGSLEVLLEKLGAWRFWRRVSGHETLSQRQIEPALTQKETTWLTDLLLPTLRSARRPNRLTRTTDALGRGPNRVGLRVVSGSASEREKTNMKNQKKKKNDSERIQCRTTR